MNHKNAKDYELQLHQIAKATGFNQSTVSAIQTRAIRKFKEEMKRRNITIKDLIPD